MPPVVGLIKGVCPICFPFEILRASPDPPRNPVPNPGAVLEELKLMLVAVGGEEPSAAAAATLVPPGGEKGLNSDPEARDCELRRPCVPVLMADVVFG
jgi:hypothetical protein